MLQEGVTYQEQVLVLSWESAFMDNEIAFFMARFVEILFWVDFENVIGHLETDWLNFWSNVLAWIFNVAESFIGCAIKIWKSSGPFFSYFLENLWRNGKLRTSSINNSWIRSVFAWSLHWCGTVEHTLSFESPGSKPILEILESFKTLSSSDNLCGVVSTEKCIRSFTHFFGCNTETDHSSINNSIVFEWPKIMKLLLFHILMWWETENTIWIVTKTLRFVERQELEEGTFVLFKFHFQFDSFEFAVFQWLDAGVVLPNETLELSRSIGELGGSFRQDFVWIGFVHIVSHCFASFMVLISLDETTLKWIVFLKLEISCGFIITQNRSNGQIFRTSIKDNSSWLTYWRAHEHSSKINGVIPAVEGHL